MTPSAPPIDRRRHRQRLWVNAICALAQAPILLAIVVGTMALAAIVGRAVAPHVIGRDITDDVVPAGLVIGIAAGAYTSIRIREWLHRLRLWWLRRRGDSATIEALWVSGDPTPTIAIEAYLVQVRWRDLAGEHIGDRAYRFRNRSTDDFLARLASDQPLVVRYPRAEARRFVIDIPYAPSMADFFI